jgi:hypothetical protein
MEATERNYRSGKIGITETGEIVTIDDPTGDPADYLNPLNPWLQPIDQTAQQKYPGWINDRDPATTCKWCNTAFRLSELHHGDRCPFCWRLIG